MSYFKIESTTVKVECMKTGDVVKKIQCGDNYRKAKKIESALMKRVDLDRFFVYQSYETKEI